MAKIPLSTFDNFLLSEAQKETKENHIEKKQNDHTLPEDIMEFVLSGPQGIIGRNGHCSYRHKHISLSSDELDSYNRRGENGRRRLLNKIWENSK